jgi:hypothetical protein
MSDYKNLKKAELLALAAERGLELPENALNADIIEALAASDPLPEPVGDDPESQALAIIRRIYASDSYTADLSGDNREALRVAVGKGWLEEGRSGHFSLTPKGARKAAPEDSE